MQTALRQRIAALSRDKADTLLLLLACTLVLMPHFVHAPRWVSAVCSILLLWRAGITWFGHRLPSRKLLLPLAIVLIASVYQTHHILFGREASVTMLILLLSLKLLEMQAKRDVYVIVCLSFFLMLTTFFYAQTIATALFMTASSITLLSAQLSFNYAALVPPLRQRLQLGALILLLATPIALVLFFLFPRVQGPLWGLPSDAQIAGTGLSDSMSPGNIASLALSDEVAFRVKFIDPVPPQSTLYWRGIVLGKYDGRTWTPLHVNAATEAPLFVSVRGTPVRHQVTLEPHGRRWIFALELPQTAPVIADNPVGFTPDGQLLTEQPIHERIRYDATSYAEVELDRHPPRGLLRDWLQLPEGYNPRTREFAARLAGQHTHPMSLIRTVLQFFHDGQFSYTLKPPLLGEHAMDDFIFTTRAGFCEHYASAFVVVMRALHIPARVVTGYQGGEIDPLDGVLRVRQSDAHAWAEVWLENRGWIRIDPTAAVAPERIEHSLANSGMRAMLGDEKSLAFAGNSWLLRLRAKWDPLTNVWNQWILDYTPDRQQKFLHGLGFDQPDWRTLIALLSAVASLVIAIIAYPLLKNRQPSDPVQTLYRSFCRHMAKHGVTRAAYEGPHAYAARLLAADSPLTADKKIKAAHFLARYEAAQYAPPGNHALSATLSQLKSLLAQCR